MIAKPQLGFSEAVKLAFGKITQMSGRSRRSEFWWFMLVYVIGYWVLRIAAGLIMLVALPATVRRLHDTGHGSWWVIASWALNIGLSIYMITSGFLEEIQSINADPFKAIGNMNLPLFGIASLALAVTSFATFIFCLLDSDPLANKYGESPKYEIVEEGD